jgi:hypothetical protein
MDLSSLKRYATRLPGCELTGRIRLAWLQALNADGWR